jgi:hypothetical protein
LQIQRQVIDDEEYLELQAEEKAEKDRIRLEVDSKLKKKESPALEPYSEVTTTTTTTTTTASSLSLPSQSASLTSQFASLEETIATQTQSPPATRKSLLGRLFGSSSSTTNDYSDEVVGVVGAVDQSSSSSSITTTSSSSSSVTSTTFNVPEEKTDLKNYFMKTSYIIKKGDKKYLFAEIIEPASAAKPIEPTNRSIYKNSDITITEFWQNKLIDTKQIGYIIEDGAEKYGVVPDFDEATISSS